MATTLAPVRVPDNSPAPVRLAMERSARRWGMKGPDSFEQWLLGHTKAEERIVGYIEDLVAVGELGRAQVLVDRMNHALLGGDAEPLEAVIEPAQRADSSEDCSQTPAVLNLKNAVSLTRWENDLTDEVRFDLRLIRAIRRRKAELRGESAS